jgi:DNA-binding MarR family transcriptional regulator
MTDRLIDKSYFIGLAEKEEKDIINYLNINKSASSRELSDFLQIDHSRTVSILDSMYGSRLIKKSIQASGRFYSSI